MEIAFVVSLVLILIGGVIMLLALQRFQPESNVKALVKQKMADIDSRTYLNDYNSIKAALIDYDTLLDYALKEKGVPGGTMGERLKSARSYFTRGLYNDIWTAHKIRNNFVHDANFRTSLRDAQHGLASLASGVNQSIR